MLPKCGRRNRRASEINVGEQAVINSEGQWVGEAPTIDFTNLENHPSGLDDGDDNTQLSQTEVVDYVNGSQVNLATGSQVDGSDVVTANSFLGYLPTELADGDADTLRFGLRIGKIASWDGNTAWSVRRRHIGWADVEGCCQQRS